MRRLLFLTVLISSAVPSFSFAKDNGGERHMTKTQERKYEQRKPDIERIDLNKDGILQQKEVKAGIQSKFDEMDLDKDSLISKKERKKAIAVIKKKNRKSDTQLSDQRLNDRMNNIDANKDGVISVGEYSSHSGDRFQKMDKDKDGAINKKEFRTDFEHIHSRPH